MPTTGLDGRRTAPGLANPNDRAISPDVNLLDGDGTDLGSPSVTAPARCSAQLDEVLATPGIALRGNAQIRVRTAQVADIFHASASALATAAASRSSSSGPRPTSSARPDARSAVSTGPLGDPWKTRGSSRGLLRRRDPPWL